MFLNDHFVFRINIVQKNSNYFCKRENFLQLHLLYIVGEERKMEENMKKKVISFMLAFLVVAIMIPIVAHAAQPGSNTPQWINTGMVSCLIGFQDSTNGSAQAHVMGHPTVNRITADVYVYVESGSNWVYVTEEHKVVDNCSLTVSCPFTAVSGARYRADYTFVVTKNGVDETITQTKYRINPY